MLEMENQYHQVKSELDSVLGLYEMAQSENSQLKIDLANIKREHAKELKMLKARAERREKWYREELGRHKVAIDKGKAYIDRYQAYTKIERNVQKAIQKKTNATLDITSENCRKLKAIIRIPMLCKKYHDMIREQNMEEFDSLETIYQEHFERLEKELLEEDVQKLSVVEQELIKRYKKTPFTPTELQGSTQADPKSMINTHHDGFLNEPSPIKTAAPLLQRFMTQEGKKREPAAKQSPRALLGTSQLPTKQKPGNKFDGSLNQSLNINFLHRKYANVENFVRTKTQEKNSPRAKIYVKYKEDVPRLSLGLDLKTSKHESLNTQNNWLNHSVSIDNTDSLYENSVAIPLLNNAF